ncbi:DUF4149 domain-containing protein [Chitinibacter bivalviorum]|uniref:DUF4149 domain-containing protein n=1 Tax=Chitinibacter bivalviorum TaxID=2739434 RepID=A0A7H9BIB0_9NEIS|nr:DUF4149 domain-containing protein [Chitinibacter bivalviorum]QLG88367.1 DUF4149 domain-containing protein [Chitinibacter bivalviorum]
MGNGIKNLLTTLWIGGMWIIGVVVAPALFSSLDKAVAGMVAGKLFHAIGWIGIVAGVFLTIWWIWMEGARAFKGGKLWLILGMLLCTLINQFAIFPLIAEIKPAVSNAAEGMFGGGLAQWHTISSLIYLLQSVLGLIYIWQHD